MQTFMVGSSAFAQQNKTQQFSYSDLLRSIETGEVQRIVIDPTTNIASVYLKKW